MPGEVSQVHAKYETSCIECHSPFNKELQIDLCLKCHESIRQDVQNQTGFHGKSPKTKNNQCRSCHREHQGRGFALVTLDPEAFDHQWTRFPLKGSHEQVRLRCEACHQAGKKYRETPSDCISCHQARDVHRGEFGKNCKECHDEISWKKTAFDHGTTRFPLTGKHQRISCESCHPNGIRKNTAMDCMACHQINDVHSSSRQTRCEQCHTTEQWKNATFDHQHTKFALTGKHQDVRCELCHKQLQFHEKLESQCLSCHKQDDEHKGRNGPRCEQCHETSGWKSSLFQHDRDTKFALSGKHQTAKCGDCHKEASKNGSKKIRTCQDCHAPENPHGDSMKNDCRTCHDEQGWKHQVRFDHDLSAFPLIGKHAVTLCAGCHLSLKFKDAKINCNSCHKSEDVHQGRLGDRCEQCHNPNGWKFWEFDHDVQTQFTLKGGHQNLKCQSCHTQPVSGKIQIPTTCVSCHKKDDVHLGAFGFQCERCHSVGSFQEVEIRR